MQHPAEKADWLIENYRGQEDRYIAVTRSAMAAEKAYMLMAGRSGAGEF